MRVGCVPFGVGGGFDAKMAGWHGAAERETPIHAVTAAGARGHRCRRLAEKQPSVVKDGQGRGGGVPHQLRPGLAKQEAPDVVARVELQGVGAALGCSVVMGRQRDGRGGGLEGSWNA